jgi:hypothetical protein
LSSIKIPSGYTHKKIPHKFPGRIMTWMWYWNVQGFSQIRQRLKHI